MVHNYCGINGLIMQTSFKTLVSKNAITLWIKKVQSNFLRPELANATKSR